MKRSSRFIALIVIVAIASVIDRLSKAWAVDALACDAAGIDCGPISFTLVHNLGAAFGMGQGATGVFVALAVAIIAVVVVWLAVGKEHSPLEVCALALVVAGGIGNLIDRLTTAYVVDFIKLNFIDFPVFNVADICVTCGVALFIVAILFFMPASEEPSCIAGAHGKEAGGDD